jgi:hypothetical protein
VIAQPDSANTTTSSIPTTPSAGTPVEASPLSPAELFQLTLYKWRYSLEAFGFESGEVRDLMFLKWLHASRHVLP